jgi:hypothetical protein
MPIHVSKPYKYWSKLNNDPKIFVEQTCLAPLKKIPLFPFISHLTSQMADGWVNGWTDQRTTKERTFARYTPTSRVVMTASIKRLHSLKRASGSGFSPEKTLTMPDYDKPFTGH